MILVFRLGPSAGFLGWVIPEQFSPVAEAEGAELRTLLIQFHVLDAQRVDSGLSLICSML